QTLLEMTSAIENTKIDKDILLYTTTDSLHKQVNEYVGITAIKTAIPYHDNLQKVKESTALLDLQASVHKGISFRVFEAIGYNKKVITTNDAVQKYDFYNPQNIMIWQNQDPHELA